MSLVLRTPRLDLRELGEGDLDFLAGLLGDAEVMRFYPKTLSRAEAAEWIARQRLRYARDGFGFWLAVERSTGRPVGQAGLVLHELGGARVPGLAYMVARAFWRRGFAFEAAAAARDHAVLSLGRRDVVVAIRPENEPSIALAGKLGFVPDARRVILAELDHLLFALPETLASPRRAPPPGQTSC